MPRIQGYEQQYAASGNIPTRQANADDFGGPGLQQLGHGVQAAGQDLGYAHRQIQLAESQRQVTDVHVALQQLRSDYTIKALEAESKAEASDTGVGHRFLFGQSGEGDGGSLKWALDTYREGIQDPTAKAAFERGAADLITHFTLHFAQAQSRMAGTYAQQQAIKMINTAQGTVQTDPSQHEAVLRDTLAAVDDPSGIFYRPGMNAGLREQIKRGVTEQISSSTVRGMMRDSPQQAKHSLMIGEWDSKISGEQKIALLQAADTAIHAQTVSSAQADAEANRRRLEAVRVTEAGLVEKLAAHDQNPTQNKMLTPQDVLNSDLAKLDPQKALGLVNLIHSRSKEDPTHPQRTNPVVMNRLFKRIHLPDNDPNKIVDMEPIYKEYENIQLSFTDMQNLRKEVVEARSPEGSVFGREKAEFFKHIEPQITKPGPFGIYADPTTPEQFYMFSQDVDALIQQYRKEQKNPRVLFDPRSPEYVGRPEFLRKYQKTTLGKSETLESAQPKRTLDEIFGVKP